MNFASVSWAYFIAVDSVDIGDVVLGLVMLGQAAALGVPAEESNEVGLKHAEGI